jgi:hypothetical protein
VESLLWPVPDGIRARFQRAHEVLNLADVGYTWGDDGAVWMRTLGRIVIKGIIFIALPKILIFARQFLIV